jgi:hypothetical protein
MKLTIWNNGDYNDFLQRNRSSACDMRTRLKCYLKCSALHRINFEILYTQIYEYFLIVAPSSVYIRDCEVL